MPQPGAARRQRDPDRPDAQFPCSTAVGEARQNLHPGIHGDGSNPLRGNTGRPGVSAGSSSARGEDRASGELTVAGVTAREGIRSWACGGAAAPGA